MTGSQSEESSAVLSEIINAHRPEASASGNTPGSEDLDGSKRPTKRAKVISATRPGRGIRKIIDLFHDLHDLVEKADRHVVTQRLSPAERKKLDSSDFVGMTEGDIEEERRDRKRCYHALEKLNKLIPGFEQKAKAAEHLNTYCAPLQSGANDARSDDTHRLRAEVADWLNSRTDDSPEGTRRLSTKRKDDRGIGNDVTGRLLCPVTYDWDNPDVRANLRNGVPGFKITSNYLLRCLYSKEDIDPDSPEDGLLRGPLLLRIYRYIFTSPSSASDENLTSEPTARRRDVATTLRLDGQVTGRSIAYAATQLVFALSSAPEWRKNHSGFHFPAFYNFIVDTFEDPEDDEAKKSTEELLKWWNGEIFPPATAGKGSTQDSQMAMQESRKLIQEARARRARKAAAHEAAEDSSRTREAAEDSSRTREGSITEEGAGQRPAPEGSVTEDDSSQRDASGGSITEDDSGAEEYAE